MCAVIGESHHRRDSACSLLQQKCPVREMMPPTWFKFDFSVASRPKRPYLLRAVRDAETRTATSTFTQRLSSGVQCCFTSIETVGLLGTGAQDGHLDFHTTPELLVQHGYCSLPVIHATTSCHGGCACSLLRQKNNNNKKQCPQSERWCHHHHHGYW